MRGVLWGTTVYNTLCALLIAFPASAPGQLAGLPEQVPLSYRVMTALMVLLWAGAYAWLANQPEPNRPMVAFAAVGKAIVFAGVLVLAFAKEVPIILACVASGELVFAAYFTWWLIGAQPSIPRGVPGSKIHS